MLDLGIEIKIAEIVVDYVRSNYGTCEQWKAQELVYETLGHKLSDDEIASIDEVWHAETD